MRRDSACVAELERTTDLVYRDLLDAADSNAKTGYEMEFVSDMKAKYSLYQGRSFVSDRQLELLRKIAGEDQ